MRFLIIAVAIVCAAIGIIEGSWLFILISILGAGIAFSYNAADIFSKDPILRILGFLESELWALILIIACMLSLIAGWLAKEFPASYIAGVFWLVAMTISILATVLHDRRDPDEGDERSVIRTALIGDWVSWDWIAIVFITLLAFGLRVYRIDQFLPPIHGDEGEMGTRALQVLHRNLPEFHQPYLPLFATSFLNHPTLYHYLQAFALWIGGESIVSLRILSAFFGALCIPLIYFIGRAGWGWIAGLLAAWLLAVSHLNIHYSRLALNNVQSLWFVLLSIALFIAIFKIEQAFAAIDNAKPAESKRTATPERRTLLPYCLLGLAIGVSQYMYYGSRLILLFAVPVIFLLVVRRQVNRRQLAVLVITIMISYWPQIFYFIQHTDEYTNRSNGVFLLSNQSLVRAIGPNYSWLVDVPKLLFLQAQKVGMFFINRGDISSFYFADLPALDPISASLFWLGLGVSLVAWRRLQEFTLLTWFGLGILFAGILTIDQPNGPRLIILMAAASLFAGIFLQRVYDRVKGAGISLTRLGFLLLSTLMILTLYLNYSTYFIKYPKSMPSLAPTTIAKMVADTHAKYHFYLLGTPNLFAEYGVFRFVDYGIDFQNFSQVEDLDELLTLHPITKDLLLFIMPYHANDIPLIKARFPTAVEQEYKDPLDRLLFYTLQVPTATILQQPVSPLPLP